MKSHCCLLCQVEPVETNVDYQLDKIFRQTQYDLGFYFSDSLFNNNISKYYKINLIPKFTSIKLNPKEVVPTASPPFGLTVLYPNCPKVASIVTLLDKK